MTDDNGPVERSLASAGEVADGPETRDDLKVIKVSATESDIVTGLLIQWAATEWFYAKGDAFQSLESRR